VRSVKILLIAGAFLFGSAGVVATVVLQDRPLVRNQELPDAESARRARALLSYVRYSLRRSNRTHILTVPERDLNGVIAFIARGLAPLSGHADVGPDGVSLRATLKLPPTPVGRFVNAEFAVQPSTRGLIVQRLARIRFNPGRILRQRRSSRIRWA